MSNQELLRTSLQLAVPLHVNRPEDVGINPAELQGFLDALARGI